MKKILDLITEEMEQAFADAGYEKELARVTLSNRPDLCEYQCNGAMAGAKKYHKAPIMIAEEVVAKIPENGYIMPERSHAAHTRASTSFKFSVIISFTPFLIDLLSDYPEQNLRSGQYDHNWIDCSCFLLQ